MFCWQPTPVAVALGVSVSEAVSVADRVRVLVRVPGGTREGGGGRRAVRFKYLSFEEPGGQNYVLPHAGWPAS